MAASTNIAYCHFKDCIAGQIFMHTVSEALIQALYTALGLGTDV